MSAAAATTSAAPAAPAPPDVELERMIQTLELDIVLLKLGKLLGTSAMGALVAGRVLRAQQLIIRGN